jgi:chromosomal replication initiation ATPase DnaA
MTATNEDLEGSTRLAARLVAALYDMPEELFLSPRKGPPAQVQARQLVVYLLTMEGGFDQKAVASFLRRHHSTAWNAVQRIEALREDPELDRGVTDLADMFRKLRAASAVVPSALAKEPE